MPTPPVQLLKVIRFNLLILITGLIISGVTAFPLETELRWLCLSLGVDPQHELQQYHGLQYWIFKVYLALQQTNQDFPFLAYGTDWLAFAHLVIALVFIGPYRDPIRHEFIIDWGLICCISIIPLALIAGHFRTIPVYWRLIDCSFGVFGAIPLIICKYQIKSMKT